MCMGIKLKIGFLSLTIYLICNKHKILPEEWLKGNNFETQVYIFYVSSSVSLKKFIVLNINVVL